MNPSPEIRTFNFAVKWFDRLTAYQFDRVDDVGLMADVARLRGWANIEQALLRGANVPHTCPGCHQTHFAETWLCSACLGTMAFIGVN